MSDAWKQYKPDLALYDVLDKPGGVSVDVALKRADQAIENYRGQAMSALRGKMTALEAIARARAAPPDSEQVYELSVFVLDIAGIYLPGLCRAAHSLCELVHRMKAAGKWDWPAIDVHVSSMRLLLEMKEGADASAKVVLDGLGAVVAKYPDPSPPDPPKPKSAPAA
jgi:hypothetical protein